jgi:hypothetical protein
MIKTISFAPPRSTNSRSTGKTSPAPRAAGKRASGSSIAIPAQTSLDFSDSPAPIEAKAEVKVVVETPQPKIRAKSKASAPKAEIIAPVPSASLATPVPISVATEPKIEAKPKTEVKARKIRVPKDLAAQYGETPAKRPEIVPVLEPETPRKRLNKAERDARRQLIRPDEDLRARLARATEIVVVKPKAAPRGKGWKFECGRCGQTSYFETPGGLCSCGTIALKDRL